MNIKKCMSPQRWLIASLCALAIQGCGGGGGSDVNPSSNDRPPAPPPAPTVDLSDSEGFSADFTDAIISVNGTVYVSFQVVDADGVGIADVTAEDVRFIVSKLNSSPTGNLTGSWQSYINTIEQPGVGPGTEPKLQATTENGTSGVLVNNEDGTYEYTFASSVIISDAEILAQADVQGLDVGFDANLLHRVAMQLSNGPEPSNPTFDFIPATGKNQTTGVWGHEIAATETCNNCHGELALHGGGRVEVKYCVACHNPGSADANSGNTVGFKNMVHKIHMGKNLPSVQAGGVYQIYGFRDSVHDYSNLAYPGDILECTDCHSGNATAEEGQVITESGDNWREVATRESCGSCHDDVDFEQHFGGQKDDLSCMNCHQNSAVAGSIEDRHRNLTSEAKGMFEAHVIAISDTAPGEFPRVQFSITNPLDGDTAYNILSDPEWTNSGSSLSIDIAWSTSDYTNVGNMGDNASAVAINALTDAEAVGDGSFIVTSTIAIPDGSLAPGVPVTGSGGVNIEGHPVVDISESGEPDEQTVALTNVSEFFSIDESDGEAVSRREVVTLENCLGCHSELSLHGKNRNDNIDGCVMCHNPRNTDRRVREVAANPPTDGKTEESIDFKTMIHGIHAAGVRNNPLQIVGYRGFSTHVYDTDAVHYPNNVGNCESCHTSDSYLLPLAETVLATTNDTGADVQDPADDKVTSPNAAVCSSCHDGEAQVSHMETFGASFDTTQMDINNGVVVEECALCHGEGKSNDVRDVHPIN